MKVYICPYCGWIRVVSRRKNVECFKCGEPNMVMTKLPYEKVGHMTEKERKDYARSWLYLHRAKQK
ncbi:MAG: DNA-directed RNA polymerase subunit M [Eubacterium sp.]|jgi:hypothetical protein|nr:DNA-directed RNA polymerase subunit M [Eubacterium sp.]